MLLYISFRFGTFYVEGDENSFAFDVIVSAIGAFIGIIGAYYLYKIQLRKQRNDTLKYAIKLIESTINYARNQSLYCKNLSERLIAEPTKFHLLQFEANSDLKRLAEKLDQEKFYHSFLNKYKRNENTYQLFKSIYSDIDYIDQSIDQLKVFLEKEYNSIYLKKRDYLIYLDEAEEKSTLLLVNKPYIENPDKLELLDYIDNLIVSYKRSPHEPTDLDYPYDTFINPLLTFLVENYPIDTKANEITVLLRKSAVKYTHFKMQSEKLAEELKSYETSLKEHAESLSTLTQNLKNDM